MIGMFGGEGFSGPDTLAENLSVLGGEVERDKGLDGRPHLKLIVSVTEQEDQILAPDDLAPEDES